MNLPDDRIQELAITIESAIGDCLDPLAVRISRQIFEILLQKRFCKDALLIGVQEAIASTLPEGERGLFVHRFEAFRSEL